MTKTETVAGYIAAQPPRARKALKEMRAIIRSAAPGLTERISYRIPTFDLDGERFLYIAGFKEHVGLYPVTKGMEAKHGKEIAKYRAGKGTLRFPLDAKLPATFIRNLARARVDELRAGGRGRSSSRS
jgi:uncharacterized protein YdhG (YjbR/CyaY superfamily)